MTILQAVADGRPGGGTTLVLSLIRHLVTEGVHAVHAIGQQESYFVDEARRLGAIVHPADFWKSRFDRNSADQVCKTVEEIRPDVAHFHGARASFYGIASIKRRLFRSVYTVHGFHFHQKGALLRTLSVMAERRICAAVEHVVFVCEDDRNLARTLNILGDSTASSVIYNGFDPSGLPELASARPQGMAYLGRLNPQKDPMLMVEIARILAERGVSTTLIGGGEMEHEVNREIARLGLGSRVRSTGILPREEALRLLAISEAFILPSKWEGFPISILEAMALKVPVVAAAVNGVPEAIDHGRTGLLVHSRKAQDFVDGAMKLHEDSEFRSRIVEEAFREVHERFTLERCLTAHSELYEELAR